jgi:deoxyribose-phosphate aldolase
VLVTQNNSRIFTQADAKNICTNQEFGKQAILHMKDTVNNRMQNGEDQIPAVEIERSVFDAKLARMIDHTLLKPEATIQEIENLCAEAKHYGFASVCINPAYVKLCADLLRNSNVKVCTVIGFPLGATSSAAKAFETEQAIKHGASEVDMVINIGMLKSGEFDYVEHDILAVVDVAHRLKVLVKVIIETGLLNDDEKIKACALAKHAGADFVKTSTGFVKGGATVEDIALMRKVVGPELGVKASGGVRSKKQAFALLASGATRIGASASVKIVTEEEIVSLSIS